MSDGGGANMLRWLPLLFVLLPCVPAPQLPIHPFYTPCNFPSPQLPHSLYTTVCSSPNLVRLPFLCDLHQQLTHTPMHDVEKMFERHRHVLETNNKTNIGIIFVRQLHMPTSQQDLLKEENSCIFAEECGKLPQEELHGYSNNVRTFLKIYTWKVYDRWFGVDNGCRMPKILAILVRDGMVNDARNIPYVKLHTGEARLRPYLTNIEMETNNAIVQAYPSQQILRDLIMDMANLLREEPRDHSVPQWARHVGLLCVVLVMLALITEWYIVRRKLAVKKSASGIKIVSGKSKTHLMF